MLESEHALSHRVQTNVIKRFTLSALAAFIAASSLVVTLATASPAAAQDNGRHNDQNRGYQHNRGSNRDPRQSSHDSRQSRNRSFGYSGSRYHNSQDRNRGHQDRGHN